MTRTSPDILVIEDDSSLNQAYETILRTAGYAVRTAFDGREALRLVAEKEPDIIFLDLRMPNLDGIGFLEEYKPAQKHKDVVVIIFSNYDSQKDIDKAYSLGAQRYVLKAWATPRELIKIVQDTIVS